MSKATVPTELICQNRKARYDYHVIETVEAGIVLLGCEVKSIREHHVSLESSYAYASADGIWLVGCNIDPYKFCAEQQDPLRKRKLLLHKKEIRRLEEKTSQTGFTLVPLRMYFSQGKIKIELALCKGKQAPDKRQAMKTKDAQKEMSQMKKWKQR